VAGGQTVHLPSGTPSTIFDASERYRKEEVPLIVIAGANYGQGSSRDWAAKGPQLLGVKVVLAQSFERIHRSNLIAMGIVPAEFVAGASLASLGLTGRESYSFSPLPGETFGPRVELEVRASSDDGKETTFRARCRIDSAPELAYYRAGGILPYVLGRMVERRSAADEVHTASRPTRSS
jgi:aconitate hydratase